MPCFECSPWVMVRTCILESIVICCNYEGVNEWVESGVK